MITNNNNGKPNWNYYKRENFIKLKNNLINAKNYELDKETLKTILSLLQNPRKTRKYI